MTARTNSLHARQQKAEARLPLVADMLVKGWSSTRIAREVSARLGTSVSRVTIYGDMKKLKEQWRKDTKDSMDSYMAESINRIKKVIEEY